MKRVKKFDGGGSAGADYGDSWTDVVPADSQDNVPDQVITYSDTPDSPVILPGTTNGALTQAASTPQQREAITAAIDEQNNSVPDPNLAGHLTPKEVSPAAAAEEGVLTKIAKGMGILNKQGTFDYSDPKTMSQLLKLLAVGGTMISTLQGPQNKKSAAELAAQLKGPFDTFNPVQQAAANSYFSNPNVGHALQYNRSGASLAPSTRRFAHGGEVDDSTPQHFSTGALSSLVSGPGGGQDDLIPARLGPGEYVLDADIVSALGDGSNEAGADKLDKWRENIRAHKRSAPPSAIPPKAKALDHYMPKGSKK